MSVSTAVIEPSARTAISDLIHEFYGLVDTGHASQTADLFLPDASLTFGPGSPQPGTVHGPAIRDAMNAREKVTSAFTRHLVTNLRFSRGGVEEISSEYLLVLFRSDDDSRSSIPAFVADVKEHWQNTADGWKIKSRVVMPAFFRG
jgi:SnoaL-like domain